MRNIIADVFGLIPRTRHYEQLADYCRAWGEQIGELRAALRDAESALADACEMEVVPVSCAAALVKVREALE